MLCSVYSKSAISWVPVVSVLLLPWHYTLLFLTVDVFSFWNRHHFRHHVTIPVRSEFNSRKLPRFEICKSNMATSIADLYWIHSCYYSGLFTSWMKDRLRGFNQNIIVSLDFKWSGLKWSNSKGSGWKVCRNRCWSSREWALSRERKAGSVPAMLQQGIRVGQSLHNRDPLA